MGFKSVSIVGLGYIGLPTAAILASRKVNVIGVDINVSTVEKINRGEIHIVEPELDVFVRDSVAAGFLRATTQIEKADVFIIAVPTPFKDDHQPDLSFIKAATEQIASVLEKGNLIILESTSPVGTTEKVVQWLKTIRPDLDFPNGNENPDIHLAYCPERVLPGHIVRELVENDRIIGGMTAVCSDKARQFYELFVEGQLLISDSRTAEMAKLTENAYRDVNIAFANELSLISEKLNINVLDLISLANHHPRVNILQPGCGVGGHCIAVDPWFIASSAPEESKLIRTARSVNDSKPDWVVSKVRERSREVLKEGDESRTLKVALLGLTYKPDIDDLRESPALYIAERLIEDNKADYLIVEPNIDGVPDSLAKCEFVSYEKAIEVSDLLVILVNHKEFVRANLSEKNVIDFT